MTQIQLDALEHRRSKLKEAEFRASEIIRTAKEPIEKILEVCDHEWPDHRTAFDFTGDSSMVMCGIFLHPEMADDVPDVVEELRTAAGV